MVSMMKSNEKLSQIYYQAHLPLLIKVQGIDCTVARKVTRVEDDAYSIHAGTDSTNDLGATKILMATSQWRIVSSYEGGWFDDLGYMYCLFDVTDGDIVTFTREDELAVRFQIVGTESLGLTTKILKRFKLANLGESA